MQQLLGVWQHTKYKTTKNELVRIAAAAVAADPLMNSEIDCDSEKIVS